MRWVFLLVTMATLTLRAERLWTVRLEEPTGLERREREVVRVPLNKVGGAREGFRVLGPNGAESRWQIAGNNLLFEADVLPGETPVYQVRCCSPAKNGPEAARLARRLGTQRIEFGNARWRMVFDTGVGAIIEAYNLSAGPQRILNLVETTPEDPKALTEDLHRAERKPLPPVPGVPGENTGWTTLGGTGPVTSAEIIADGPLFGLIRIIRGGETAEFEWTAGSAWVRWRASRGFRFTAISASPYLPFDRYLDTPESELWPDVSSRYEPPDHDIGPRDRKRLRAGHGVYYQLAANYGALGIVALDPELEWTGAGARRVVASKSGGATEIALTFPKWAGFRTLLEARREYRILRNPILVRVNDTTPAAPRSGGSPRSSRQQALSLNGDWELAHCDKGCDAPAGGWRTVQVPGTVHVQWLGREQAMTRSAEWVSYKEWWYRKRFDLPASFKGKRLRLKFEATDYYADAWLNGRYLGRHEGYIDPYEYDVTGDAGPGAHQELLVRVWTPVSYYWRHRPYTIKGSYGAVDQKPDDITALGITRSVTIVAGDTRAISDVAVDTRLTAGSDAEVDLDLEADGTGPAYRWEVALSPRNFEGGGVIRAASAAGNRPSRIRISVPNARLWWTWDHGRPNLYTLEVKLVHPDGTTVDERRLAVGIREIEKIGWNFYLNRKRMFIRGTNYYYNLFLSEMNRAAYERDLGLMLQMNVNMIRLHCHFSNPEFYDLADEKGVLVWQDFLEAWYPEDSDFSVRSASLYDNHIRYVRNHASVALWAACDEESLENYRDLSKHLAARAALLDQQRRPVVRSTGRYGDSHVYNGWYGGSIWEYARMNDVFVSELGATSLPNYETLVKFMPDQWPIRDHEQEWIWRKLQIPEAMRAWGDPGNMTLREYIPKTQAYVARLFQIALERARRRKRDGAGGILHFHAIDIWPSVTMAAIDVDRIPTTTFYTVQRSFEPAMASIEYDRDRWKAGEEVRCGLWAINDRWESLPDARIEWRILAADQRVSAAGSVPVLVPADSSQPAGDVRWVAKEAGAYQLAATLYSGSNRISENIFEFEVIK